VRGYQVDPAVTAIIDEYEARAAAEAKLMTERPADAMRRRDDMLLPVGRSTATLLNLLIKESEARRILEVGTSYGYSTVWLAEAARETGGKVITLELKANKADYARERLVRAGLDAVVEFQVGDALETLRSVSGPFDFVLIDLWKDLYVASFDLIYPQLAEGAIIVADNMIYPQAQRENARAYRKHIKATPGMTSVLLPVGSGIELSRYQAD
jgi:predicted O-methyltransferase YrrM